MEPDLFDDLRRRLAQPGPWAERFRRLAEDIAASQADEVDDWAPGENDLTCEDFKVTLEQLIEDDLQGKALTVPARFRAHLATCQACRDSYMILRSGLKQERSAPLAQKSPSLSFLRTPTDATPWLMRLPSRLMDSKFGLQVSIRLDYVRATLSASHAALAVRAEDTLPAPLTARLLMSDALPVGNQLVAAEVSLLHDLISDQMALHVVITGSQGLPPLCARLQWANVVYTAPVEADGSARFTDLHLEDLPANLATIDITFEPDDQADESA